MLLLEQKFISRNVPISDGLAQRFLKHHVTPIRPDLEQELHAIVVPKHGRVDDFAKHRAELSIVIVLAAGDDFVEFVERHLIHDLLHELLRRPALVVFKLVRRVLMQYFLHLSVLHCLLYTVC